MNLLTLIVGKSGAGKSTSARNLGKDTVLFNFERKMLPYRSSGHANVPINSVKRKKTVVKDRSGKDIEAIMSDLEKWVYALKKRPDIKNVIIDSFSAYVDMCERYSTEQFSGYDIYKNYNAMISDLFELLKSLENKYVFLTGHVHSETDADGITTVHCKVAGKQWSGVVEKEATCVFYADPKVNEDGTVEYRFMTNTDGRSPAKTPMGMFEERFVGNDLAEIIKVYDDYYGNPITVVPREEKTKVVKKPEPVKELEEEESF